MKMKRLLQLLCCLPWMALGTQTPLAIGEWQSLLSYRIGAYVTEMPEEIAYSTGKGIFFIDKEDLSIRRLSRENGLSETRIRLIRYHPPTENLIIVYQNSVIDLYKSGQFRTLRQISNFNFSGGDNSINDLFFGEGNLVYIAAGYGISALNLEDESFEFTTFTGIGINGLARFQNQLWAATNEGIYSVASQGTNLNDFSEWTLLNLGEGNPPDFSSTAINVWRDELYFSVNEDIWRWNQGQPLLHYDADDKDYRLQYLSAGPFYLLAGYRPTTGLDRQVVLVTETGFDREIITNCVGPTNYAIEESSGRIWFGEDWEGIRYLEASGNPECNRLFYPGPWSDRNYRMEHDGESLWVASGALSINLSPTGNTAGLFRFKEGQWTTYNRQTREALRGRDGIINNFDDPADFVGVAVNETTNQVWVGTFLEGAFTVDRSTEAIELYDEMNSPLQNANGEVAGRVRVGQPAVDADGNVYLPNTLANGEQFISVQSPDGRWAALGAACDRNEAFAVAVDNFGFIWVLHGISRGGGGITVIDPGQDLFDPSDDVCRSLTASNTALPTNEVRSIAIDLSGEVWIGTARGVMVFDCGGDVMNAERCAGREIAVFDEEGNGGLLLETEDCFSITVDGANRKWVGAAGGAYLLSEDGREQLAFFDTRNSPMLNNTVRDIAINPRDGTVFFGTEDGISSYKSNATQAGRLHRDELLVYPNPVEPGYAGPIAIDGLSRNARVKITDLSGKLVAEGNAFGGQFIWDGADYNGRRVQSGVYLVFAATNSSAFLDRQSFGPVSPDAVTGKIVFLR